MNEESCETEEVDWMTLYPRDRDIPANLNQDNGRHTVRQRNGNMLGTSNQDQAMHQTNEDIPAGLNQDNSHHTVRHTSGTIDVTEHSGEFYQTLRQIKEILRFPAVDIAVADADKFIYETQLDYVAVEVSSSKGSLIEDLSFEDLSSEDSSSEDSSSEDSSVAELSDEKLSGDYGVGVGLGKGEVNAVHEEMVNYVYATSPWSELNEMSVCYLPQALERCTFILSFAKSGVTVVGLLEDLDSCEDLITQGGTSMTHRTLLSITFRALCF